MSEGDLKKRTWRETLVTWSHPRVITMLFFGFSAGIPFSLTFFTLSIWLSEAGISPDIVTFFSWAALGYSFKFVWAPLVDRMPLPLLTAWLGRRRSWLLFSQIAIITAIVWMAMTNPAKSHGHNALAIMAMADVMLGFAAATQDIVIDAYRIECVETSLQALLSSMYIAGYRIGMLMAGAGALFLASHFEGVGYHYSAWRSTYLIMVIAMGVGVVTTLVIPEPELNREVGDRTYSIWQYARFLSLFLLVVGLFATVFFMSASFVESIKTSLTNHLAMNKDLVNFGVETCRLLVAILFAGLGARFALFIGMVDRKMVFDTYVDPIREFFLRYGGKTALLLLALIGFYRVSDIVLGSIANIFYLKMGYSKDVIAAVTKVYGVGMTILGGFLGGVLTLRFGVYAILFLGALLASASNLFYVLLAWTGGHHIAMLTLVIAVDNLSGGLAATAFVAFLSSLTNISFTAVQYALFSSMMTLFPRLIGGYSGEISMAWGYTGFFILTAAMGIPVLILIWMVKDIVEVE